MRKRSPNKKRLQGVFSIPYGQKVFGEIRLRGSSTTLNLHHHDFITAPEEVPAIHGNLHDLYKISCIDCILQGTGSGSDPSGENGNYHFINLFPHYVTIGNEHLYPTESTIKAVHFSVTDINNIFFDFDAFGSSLDTVAALEAISTLNEKKGFRPIDIGSHPIIAYFSGKIEIISINTEIGKVSINHRPSFSMASPRGVQISSQMVVTFEPVPGSTFRNSIEKTLILLRFLSLLAGRSQGIKFIQLELSGKDSLHHTPLQLYWSHAPKRPETQNKYTYERPHPGDIPLNAIHRPDEFSSVLQDWIARDSQWKISRARYSECLEKGNYYNVDRLVAAANMFDILPDAAAPQIKQIPEDLDAAKTSCLEKLKELPYSVDRDSAIQALHRIGRPSLTKKVLHRAKIVQEQFLPQLPELDFVAKTAVKCRNLFVHGSSSDFNYEAIEPMTTFLNDALEFIFAASDLIDAGWDAKSWHEEPFGTGHSFSRFLRRYDHNLRELKAAVSASM